MSAPEEPGQWNLSRSLAAGSAPVAPTAPAALCRDPPERALGADGVACSWCTQLLQMASPAPPCLAICTNCMLESDGLQKRARERGGSEAAAPDRDDAIRAKKQRSERERGLADNQFTAPADDAEPNAAEDEDSRKMPDLPSAEPTGRRQIFSKASTATVYSSRLTFENVFQPAAPVGRFRAILPVCRCGYSCAHTDSAAGRCCRGGRSPARTDGNGMRSF